VAVEKLLFSVNHDETVAKDISSVLNRIDLPKMQSARRHFATQQFLNQQPRPADDTAVQPITGGLR